MGLIQINKCLNIVKIIFCFIFALTFPVVAYQPHSSMTVSATFVADVDRWLRRVCRVCRLLLPLLPLYSFIYSPLLFSFLPKVTTALQCPRPPAAASHVVVSIHANVMSRLHVSL